MSSCSYFIRYENKIVRIYYFNVGRLISTTKNSNLIKTIAQLES